MHQNVTRRNDVRAEAEPHASQEDGRGIGQATGPAAPAAVPVATPAAKVAAPAVVPVPPGALAGSALRTLQAQLTCTAELSAGWYKLMLAASHSASQLWLGKVQG